MTLHLFDTYTRARQPFVPLDPDGRTVLLYSCGPTVYSYAHIGNFRSFLVADLLARTLRRRGYAVRHVMNITDVGHMTEDHLADATGEDKLARAARELGSDPFAVARHFEDAFASDARRLRMSNYQGEAATAPTLHPRATRFVPEMLAAIQHLLERGYAYLDGTGQAYFEIARFPEYGRLSGKPLDELEAGARVEVRAEKRDPRDFALWKVEAGHLMQWDPHHADGWPADDWARLQRLVPDGLDPGLGRGFPGWHIECSAMSRACLGAVIDIHTGGEDNVFPHHECEIAQSFGAYGDTTPGSDGGPRPSFARYWVHGRHLVVNGRKMSKRDGTFFTVRDVLDPATNQRPDLAASLTELGFAGGRVPAPVLRWTLLSQHHATQLNFSFDLLVAARAAVGRMQACRDRLADRADEGAAGAAGDASGAAGEAIARARVAFDEALDDDLDVAGAQAAVLTLVGELNQLDLSPADAAAAVAALDDLDGVLDVLDRGRRTGVIGADDLTAWADPDHRRARAAALAAWHDLPDRRPLVEALAAGQLPTADDLAGCARLDEDVVAVVVAARAAARAARDFATADRLRDLLRERGVKIEDGKTGTRWRLGST